MPPVPEVDQTTTPLPPRPQICNEFCTQRTSEVCEALQGTCAQALGNCFGAHFCDACEWGVALHRRVGPIHSTSPIQQSESSTFPLRDMNRIGIQILGVNDSHAVLLPNDIEDIDKTEENSHGILPAPPHFCCCPAHAVKELGAQMDQSVETSQSFRPAPALEKNGAQMDRTTESHTSDRTRAASESYRSPSIHTAARLSVQTLAKTNPGTCYYTSSVPCCSRV